MSTLTDAEIAAAWDTLDLEWPVTKTGMNFARAVERALLSKGAAPAEPVAPAVPQFRFWPDGEDKAFEAWFQDYCGTGTEGALFDQPSAHWLDKDEHGRYTETRVRDAWTGWMGRSAKALVDKAAQ
jgi:hypothetical protein